MPGEQAASVAIRTASQQDEIENGRLDRVLGRKLFHELLLIVIGELLGIMEERFFDGNDRRLAFGLGDLGEELLLEQAVVGVFVVEGNSALVGEEDLPLVPVDFGIVDKFVGGEGCGERASGYGDAKDVVTGEGGVLVVDDELVNLRLKGGLVGVGEEDGFFRHCGVWNVVRRGS